MAADELVAVTLWEAYSKGREPYDGFNGVEVVEYIKSGERLRRPIKCPESIYNVMKECWQEDMEKRPSFRELANVFATNSPMYENVNLLAKK